MLFPFLLQFFSQVLGLSVSSDAVTCRKDQASEDQASHHDGNILESQHTPAKITKVTTPDTMANHSRLLNSPATALISLIKFFVSILLFSF